MPHSAKPNKVPPALKAGLTSSTEAFHPVPDELLSPRKQAHKENFCLVSPKKAISLRLEHSPEDNQNPKALRRLSFCQDGVSESTREGVPLEELSAQMNQNGWLRSPKGTLTQPIDIVDYGDEAVTVDHRRVVSACADDVSVRLFCHVHQPNEHLPRRAAHRFRFPDGRLARTWGEAVDARLDANTINKWPTSDLPKVRRKYRGPRRS